jgi:acetyl esterase/lipase
MVFIHQTTPLTQPALSSRYSTDELFFVRPVPPPLPLPLTPQPHNAQFNHEWAGRPWDPKTKALSEKFSPSNYVANWSTPQLLIHGSKDFRLPETESIGAFHALQQLGVPTRLVVFPTENHWCVTLFFFFWIRFAVVRG